MAPIRRIIIKREVLLFEIERRCSFTECNQRIFMGLTKQEAQDYNGYECTFCERWNTDALKRTDIPDWWEELQSNQPTSH